MIISSKQYLKHSYIKGGLILLKFVFFKFISSFKFNLKSSNSLPKSMGANLYPVLELADENTIKCNSCNLCSKVCPTSCIEIVQNKQIQIDSSSVLVGPPPKNFKIKLRECIQCNLCVEVCPVFAISLSGNYNLLDHESGIWDINELKLQSKPPKMEF